MTRAESFVEYLRRFTGVRYYWPSPEGGQPSAGNDDPILGFDCSGLVCEGLRREGAIGYTERLGSKQLLARFSGLAVWTRPETGYMHAPPFKTGDLLFYGTALDGVSHVAVVADEWHLIEAGAGGKGTDTDVEAAALNAFVRERPLAFRGAELQAVVRVFPEEAK